MATISPKELARNLAAYLAHVEVWDDDQGDSFLMLNYRELIAEHEQELTANQKNQLQLADKKIISLALADYEEETPDVGFLRLTAKVINDHGYHREAA